MTLHQEVSKTSSDKPITILIIDDSPEDRDIYRQFLLQNADPAHQVLEADTGEEGLQCLQQYGCDLVLLDFQLPDMDGLEVLTALNQSMGGSIPVIMLTGRSDAATAVQAMKQGVYDYLVKQQVTPDTLQSAVRNALARADLQTQLAQSQHRQSFISSIALRIRQTLDLDEVLERATVEAHNLLGCDRILVYKFAADMSGTIVAESVDAKYQSVLGQEIIDTCFQNGLGKHYAQGQSCVISDIYQAQLSPCHINLLKQFNIRANLVVPIVLTSQQLHHPPIQSPSPQLWGLLIAHQCDQPRVWTTEEIQLIELLSVQLAIAIRQAELLSRTKIALQREQELNELKSQIVATISHEYQAPLASILAAASTLKVHQQALSATRRENFLDIIAQKARHMSSLVDDMLFMNQMELGQIPLKLAPINIAKFLQESIEDYREQNSGHVINFEITGNVDSFHGDLKVLEQIFNNLFSNAIKYSPTGNRIDVRLSGQNSQIILVIEDQGIGISPADQTHLFQPFHRGSNVETIPGTGLGLSIVKACVEMSGGKISYHSQLGQGTRITVGLPRMYKGCEY